MLKTIKVIGLNSDQQTAQALISSGPNGDSSLQLLFTVFCSLDDAFVKTRQALSEAENIFFSSTQPISTKITEAFSLLKQSLAGAEDLSILCVCAQEETEDRVLYLIRSGDFLQAQLFRNNNWIKLSQTIEEEQLLSGFIQENDRVIIFSNSILELCQNNLDNLAILPLESLEDEITAKLPQAQPYPVALLALQVETEVKPEETQQSTEAVSPKSNLQFKIPQFHLNFKGVLNFVINLFQSKQFLLIFGIVLILVVLVGGFKIIKSKQTSQIESNFEVHFNKASQDFARVNSQPDNKENMTLLNSIKEEINLALKVKPQDKKALELKQQAEEKTPQILKIYPVNDLSLWLDLDLIKKNFSTQYASSYKGKMLLLDTKQKILLEVNLNSKAHQVLSGGEKLGSAQFATYNYQIPFIFSEDLGVLKIDNNTIANIIKDDPSWGDIIDLQGYGGNVYLLDKGGSSSTSSADLKTNGQIWKYLPIAQGYSDKRAYIKEGIKTDLSQAKKFQIDSSVWVLRSDGKILKYLSGSPENFAISGLDKPLQNPRSFFVSDEADNIYILDNNNQRLIILNKEGEYLAQYLSEKFTNFSDLVVDEQNKKVYFIEGSKIYWIGIR